MKFYLLGLLLTFFSPVFMPGQKYYTKDEIWIADQQENVIDTIYLDTEWDNLNVVAISISIISDAPENNIYQVFLDTPLRRISMEPGCETNQIDFDYVSGLVHLEKGDLGKIKIFLKRKFDYIEQLKVKIDVFGYSSNDLHRHIKSVLQLKSCACPMPDFVPRADWGSAFNLTGDIYRPPASYTDVSHLIVHHSATSNVSNDWSAVVASIFNYHANTNQWQDIGYNWLIDPNGILYEGRGGGDNVRGAHMCGYNNNTMGICVLGTFTNVDPTEQALATLNKLLSYKACQKNFDPQGSASIISYPGNMFRISGHKDGCSPNYTECPGNKLHAFLPNIRNHSETYILDSCEIINDVVGIKQNKKNVDIKHNGQFYTITSNKDGNVIILSTEGKITWQQKIKKGDNSFELFLSTGIYFLYVNTDEGFFVEKIIQLH
ncbi:MAG: N-acetylmuramoyl-L-alanine amidase [Saprospiraceae bacterium]